MTSLISPKEPAIHEFFRPVGKSNRFWTVICFGPLMVASAVGLFFVLQTINAKPEKAPVFGVVGVLLVFLIMTLFSLMRDRFQYQSRVGLQFTNDWVYLHRLMGKMKIHWNDVKKVSFSPVVLTSKDPLKRSAYMQIQSSKKTYTMVVTNYEAILRIFQERKIPTTVLRWKVPVYAVGFFVSMNTLRPLGAIIISYLLLTSYFSKNRILSRKTELLAFITGLLAVATILLLIAATKK